MAFTIWNGTHGLHIFGRRFAFIYPLLEITGSGYIAFEWERSLEDHDHGLRTFLCLFCSILHMHLGRL